MKPRFFAALCAVSVLVFAGCKKPDTVSAAPTADEIARWEATAKRVTIIRDNWGIPHIYAKTDADVVFGAMYAQAEDDFHRVERNYVNAMGRLAETAGEAELYRDLRMKLFIDPVDMKKMYTQSPEWLRKLMDSYADGLNYYLYKNASVKPEVITRFEPWMALTFSEGSIGGDIESVSLNQLEALYGSGATVPAPDQADVGREPEPSGSNGFAIAPSNTTTGHSLLMINPHTSFYFRAELQMVSEEGLNAYGASTWGQFFIYQGFNDRLGWMHTSGGADVIDEYLLTVEKRKDGVYYKYGTEDRKLREKTIVLPYKKADGTMDKKVVLVYYSHYGPVVRQANGKWVSVKLMEEPMKALMQSYGRTKARDYAAFNEVMNLRTNSSNNTVYADADGNIAYWHGNFAPKRDTMFDFSKPVDGSNPATEWKGLHEVSETITLFNPNVGWIQNTNNTPYSASGPDSPKRANYPAYMAPSAENARGIHAVRVLQNRKDFTLDKMIAAAFDPDVPAFDDLIPPLVRDYNALPATDPRKAALKEPVDSLRLWKRQWGVASVPMSLADYWGSAFMRAVGRSAREKGMSTMEYMASAATADERLGALEKAVETLTADFGNWKMPWGEINRFQRLTDDLNPPYDDNKPSFPVMFASATWGSLAAYGNTAPKTTKKNYGNRGNSFVAAVEFGPTIRAKAVTAGGQSGDTASVHFADQIEAYATGKLRDVLFYRADVEKHAERTYNPGSTSVSGNN
jgi:acyl-homoserine-lactone acylase